MTDYKFEKFIKKLIFIGAIVIAAGIVFFQSIAVIPTGYTGVKTTFGQVDAKPMASGFNWKIPFVQSVEKVNNKQQDTIFSDKVWSETSERTVIFFESTTVSYRINGEKSSWICANVSDYKNRLITETLVASSIKRASKTMTSVDVTNRGLVEPLVQELLQESVNDKYGEDVIMINKVVISNIDFEESYNQVIAEKQNAQLEYEKQQIENKTAIEQAEAQAEAKRKSAQGEADAKIIQAEAEADANHKISESLTDEILKGKYYEKWNGELPRVYGAEGTMIQMPAE